jgi:HAD superfamily hydrolase (TIGR01458 family)
MTTDLFAGVRGILFDIDGVLHIDERPIPGAVEALRHVKGKGIACRFVTNTTTKSIRRLFQKISGLGFPIEPDELFSAPQAAVHYLRRRGGPICYLVLNDEVKEDFAEFPSSGSAPDFVVIGDIREDWRYERLNRIFRMLIGGAKMIALHKGRYWQTGEGLQLDIGAFVAGLEYATGSRAIVLGKPSARFFTTAVSSMGLKGREVLMIGDDIDSDVGGAQRAGIRGILVRTGKYRDELVARSAVRPDAILESVAALVDRL